VQVVAWPPRTKSTPSRGIPRGGQARSQLHGASRRPRLPSDKSTSLGAYLVGVKFAASLHCSVLSVAPTRLLWAHRGIRSPLGRTTSHEVHLLCALHVTRVPSDEHLTKGIPLFVNPADFVSPTTPARMLGVSKRHVLRLIQQDELAAVMTPLGRLVDRGSVEQLAADRASREEH
jgi:excisionase family DNA binding protein